MATNAAGRDRGRDRLRRPVDLHHAALGEAPHLDGVERDPPREQPRAVAEPGRVHHQAVLVDQLQPCQRLDERRPAVRDDRPASSCFKRPISSPKSPAATVEPAQKGSVNVFEKTTFGISFIGAAKGSADVGQ